MASLTSSRGITALARRSRWILPPFSISLGVAVVLAVVLLVITGSLIIFVRSQQATIASQAAIIRHQADTVGHYEQTQETLLRAAHQYAARLLVLNEVAEMDASLVEATGQLQAQHRALARALHEGGQSYAEAAMVEQMLQRIVDNLQSQRHRLLAQ